MFTRRPRDWGRFHGDLPARWTPKALPLEVASGLAAFHKCESLRSVTLPDSVTLIDKWGFSQCTGLTYIAVPDSVVSISDQLFYGCTGLTSVTVGSSVKSIGMSAFDGCTSLTSIVIPDSVVSIGDFAFSDCTLLASIEYEGTMAQWRRVRKSPMWWEASHQQFVRCADGDLPA